MSETWASILFVVVCVMVLPLGLLYAEYFATSEGMSAMARRFNLRRRRWERANAWQDRVMAAHDNLVKAEWAAIEEARRQGNYKHEGRATTYWLPENHPLSVAVQKARNGET